MVIILRARFMPKKPGVEGWVARIHKTVYIHFNKCIHGAIMPDLYLFACCRYCSGALGVPTARYGPKLTLTPRKWCVCTPL